MRIVCAMCDQWASWILELRCSWKNGILWKKWELKNSSWIGWVSAFTTAGGRLFQSFITLIVLDCLQLHQLPGMFTGVTTNSFVKEDVRVKLESAVEQLKDAIMSPYGKIAYSKTWRFSYL